MIRISRSLLVVSSCLALGACAAEDVASLEQNVIYDDDDRIEVYQDSDSARRTRAEQSIVALIPKGNLTAASNGYTIAATAGTLDDFIHGAYGAPLCGDQAFRDQPAAGNCSGTLIDDDLVLTAGHCVDSMSACSGQYFVFDYFYTADGTLAQIDADDVYECDDVVAFQFDGAPPYLDFAIVRLDRPVVGREAAPIDPTDDAVAIGSSITVMGFGSGLPLKIDTGGVVISSTSGLNQFDGTPDTFGGNSGSGVFDDAGNVVGILVAGQADYVERVGQNCYEVNRLDPDVDDPVGETITYVHRAIEELCDGGDATEHLCGPGAGGGGGGKCSVETPGREGTAGFVSVLMLSCLALTAIRRRR